MAPTGQLIEGVISSLSVQQHAGICAIHAKLPYKFLAFMHIAPTCCCVFRLARLRMHHQPGHYLHSHRSASGSRTPPWLGLCPPSPSTRRKS